MGLRGDYTIGFGGSQITGIETLALLSASDPRYAPATGQDFDYFPTLNDGFVTGTSQFTVNGNGLRADETMVVDGSGETTGSLKMIGGAAADTLTGGGGTDSIFGGLGADTLRGNGGADTFIYSDIAQSTTSAADQIKDFAHDVDKIDLSLIDADGIAAGNQAFSWIGGNAFTGSGAASAGQLRAYLNGGTWFVEGDTNGDGTSDFVILVDAAQPLTASDFLF